MTPSNRLLRGLDRVADVWQRDLAIWADNYLVPCHAISLHSGYALDIEQILSEMEW